MYSSLESTRVRALHGLDRSEAATVARALSRAYAELAAHGAADRSMPCGPVLEIIATRLIRLFAGERAIDLRLSLEQVALPAEQRRALVLIASELVINALKYAFPAARAGAIRVTLVRHFGKIELCVADDGIGLLSPSTAGSGEALMARLAALLNAEIRRVGTRSGLQIIVSIPAG